jgi:hypothetical protein
MGCCDSKSNIATQDDDTFGEERCNEYIGIIVLALKAAWKEGIRQGTLIGRQLMDAEADRVITALQENQIVVQFTRANSGDTNRTLYLLS